MYRNFRKPDTPRHSYALVLRYLLRYLLRADFGLAGENRGTVDRFNTCAGFRSV